MFLCRQCGGELSGEEEANSRLCTRCREDEWP
jgi:hypothetical protein